MAKFDIIIPVHNTGIYLKECLDSVLNQSFKDFRIIAVDDKSTDNSLEILRKYEEKYPERIKVIESKINVGAGEARNIALRIAEAEYITFLDSDDTLNLMILQIVKNIIEQHHPDMIVTNTSFNYKGLSLNFLGMKRNTNNINQMINPREFKKHIYEDRPAGTAKFIKRDLIHTEFPKIKWEDYPFAVPYLCSVNSIYYLNDIGYYYRINLFGTTVRDITKFNPKVLDIFTGSDIIVDTLGKDLCEYYKNELRIVKTMNCLQRVRDLCFVTNISKEDKVLLANYLINLINIREGNYQKLDYYNYQKSMVPFYKFRMEKIENLITPSLQQETNEETIKQKIKTIAEKYE